MTLASKILEFYALIMDGERNPLRNLPTAQRFQMMTYLAIMWTAIFCTAFGSWYWYGQLLLAHMIIIVGVLITSAIFSSARRGQRIPALEDSSRSGRR